MLQVTSLEEQSQESLAESTAENDARIVDKHCKVHSEKVAIDSEKMDITECINVYNVSLLSLRFVQRGL